MQYLGELLDAESNQTFSDGLNFTFLEDGDWNKIIESVTVNSSSDAEVWVYWTYPTDGEAHTVTVSVNLLNGSEVKHMVEPKSLEVYRETKLLFWGLNVTIAPNMFSTENC